MLGMLGEGTYGEVHLARDKKTGRKVAIKVGEKGGNDVHQQRIAQNCAVFFLPFKLGIGNFRKATAICQRHFLYRNWNSKAQKPACF